MLLYTPYSRRLLGILVIVFLISHWLKKYRTSYMAISIYFIKLKENIADPLTKDLSKEQVNCSSRGMGLKPMT